MWDMKCMIIPVRTGATGIVTKGFIGELGNRIRKTLNIFSTKHSCARNITHNTESAAM
jgi:hypothetical protein